MQALNGGYHIAYLVGAGLIAAAIAVALLAIRTGQAPHEHRELVHLDATCAEAA
jgi:hypothetical protein